MKFGDGWFGEGTFGEVISTTRRIRDWIMRFLRKHLPWLISFGIPVLIVAGITLYAYIAHARTQSSLFTSVYIPEVGDPGTQYATDIRAYMLSTDEWGGYLPNIGAICATDEIYKVSGGAWVCTADAGGSGTTYSAGEGLALSNTEFSVMTCSDGESIVNSGGSAWICTTVTGTDTTYNAGTNMGLAGTTFSVVDSPTFAGDVTIQKTAPVLKLDDSTGSATDYDILVNQNSLDFRSYASGGGTSYVRAKLSESSFYLNDSIPIIFEGSVENGNETTLTVDGPTADRTVTLPDATGTVALTSDITTHAALGSIHVPTNCTSAQIPAWDDTTNQWGCADDADSGGNTLINNLGDASAAGSVDLEGNDWEVLQSGTTVFRVGSDNTAYSLGGFSSGVSDGERILNAENSSTPTSTVLNQGDIFTDSGTPKVSKAGGSGVEIYHVGGTDVGDGDLSDDITVDGSKVVRTTSTLEGLVTVVETTGATLVVTEATCDGTLHVNSDADTITYTLPSATAGLICAFSNASQAETLVVDTASGDIMILGTTGPLDSGDKVSSANTAAYATFVALDDTYWMVLSAVGTWADSGP